MTIILKILLNIFFVFILFSDYIPQDYFLTQTQLNLVVSQYLEKGFKCPITINYK